MREILFRGKRTDNGEWVTGFFTNCYFARLERANGSEYGDPVDYIRVDIDTVGEYTGLTDKNCKKIFEGDLIKVVTVDTHEERIAEVCIGEFEDINTDDLYVGVYLKHNEDIYSAGQLKQDKVDFEVIGNIHDNPKLLKLNKK